MIGNVLLQITSRVGFGCIRELNAAVRSFGRKPTIQLLERHARTLQTPTEAQLALIKGLLSC